MNGLAYTKQIRWVIIVCLCITVFLGVLYGGTKFSAWGKQVSLALAAPPETEYIAFPSVGNFDPHFQRGNASTHLMGPTSIALSTITTKDCYQSGDTWTLCFTVHNASPDDPPDLPRVAGRLGGCL